MWMLLGLLGRETFLRDAHLPCFLLPIDISRQKNHMVSTIRHGAHHIEMSFSTGVRDGGLLVSIGRFYTPCAFVCLADGFFHWADTFPAI